MSAAPQRDFARRVEIHSGRKLYLECRGRGGPTVILVRRGGSQHVVRLNAVQSIGRGAFLVFAFRAAGRG